MTSPSITFIGCGAVVEALYAPGIRASGLSGDRIMLVDRDPERTRLVAANLGVPDTHCATDHRELLEQVDGAIVAVPPAAHYTIVRDCLDHGVHVLCEKPLTEYPEEARGLVELAEERDLVLAVNNTRRVSPAARKVKELVSGGALGRIVKMEYYEGGEFDWPTASGFYFDHRVNSKGVLMDRGSHVVDLLCWWLDARPELLEYRDDSFGGPEAVAELRFAHEDCEGIVLLSWLNKLRNTFRVTGERGSLRGGIYDWGNLTLETGDGNRSLKLPAEARSFQEFVQVVTVNFLECLKGGQQPLIPGSEVLNSIDLIAECYRRRTRFSMPWYDELQVIDEF